MTKPDGFYSLPNDPGIYKMLGADGDILYVGKAKDLKKRVSSYFLNLAGHDLKTQHLVKHIASVETIITRSEREALILERQLIREYSPRYNILLKDDKSYPMIKVTVQEAFPRVLIVRDRYSDGARYFGPFPSVGSTRYLQRMLLELFPLRDCKKHIDLVTRQRKCIQLDIGNCIGPCVKKDVKGTYDQYVSQLMLLLQGKNRSLIRSIRSDMQQCAERRDYEQAATLRDRIEKLEALSSSQYVDLLDGKNMHVWSLVEDEQLWYLLVQAYADGQLLYQSGFYLEKSSDVMLDMFVGRSFLSYLDLCEVSPQEVLVPDSLLENLDEVVSVLEGVSFKLRCPKRGPRLELLELGHKNALHSLKRLKKSRTLEKEISLDAVLDRMRQVLGLMRVPKRIIGMDISHLSGQDIVASAVYFLDGQPFKSLYRRFKIRSVSGASDDFQSMYEVVLRRLQLCMQEEEAFPDLLVIDGGKGQLNAACRAVQETPGGDGIDVISLAKKEELIFFPGESDPMRLDHSDQVLQLIQRVRDESHRFAVSYQRQRRHSRALKSELSKVPGLGPKRINRLFQMYKTLDAIRLLDAQTLSKQVGISRQLSEDILDALG